jgi:hypothetical protein
LIGGQSFFRNLISAPFRHPPQWRRNIADDDFSSACFPLFHTHCSVCSVAPQLPLLRMKSEIGMLTDSPTEIQNTAHAPATGGNAPPSPQSPGPAFDAQLEDWLIDQIFIAEKELEDAPEDDNEAARQRYASALECLADFLAVRRRTVPRAAPAVSTVPESDRQS